MISKEIQILAEDTPSTTTLKKWVAEFKRRTGSTKNDTWSSLLKSSTTDKQDSIHHYTLDDRLLTIQ